MRTFDDMHNDLRASGAPCAYWGERGLWLVTAGRHRDSDALEESNFRVLLQRLGGESDTVAIERESHWAVGWVEHLLISPDDAERVAVAEKAREDLEQYPVLDDGDLSELEQENFFSWAESELQSFDHWHDALWEVQQEHDNSGPGDDSWESNVIEQARQRLKDGYTPQPKPDPNQLLLPGIT